MLAALFAVEIVVYRPGGRRSTRLAAGTFVAAAALGLPLAFMVGLRLLCSRTRRRQAGSARLGLVPLVSLIAVVKAGDIAAYVVGFARGPASHGTAAEPGQDLGGSRGVPGRLGRRRVVRARVMRIAPPGPALGGWLGYGLAVGLAGMVGDLAESLVKRELGAKDSGRSLGGMGGVLDLVDSLLFAAPVAWVLWIAGY